MSKIKRNTSKSKRERIHMKGVKNNHEFFFNSKFQVVTDQAITRFKDM